MRNNAVLDPQVEAAGKNASVTKLVLGTVGPEADDALGPGARDAGRLHKLRCGCVIDVDALFRRQAEVCLRGMLHCLGQAGLGSKRGRSWKYPGKKHHKKKTFAHAFILRYGAAARK